MPTVWCPNIPLSWLASARGPIFDGRHFCRDRPTTAVVPCCEGDKISPNAGAAGLKTTRLWGPNH